MPLRILIADDHEAIRAGTRAVIERHEGWEVCGTAATGREAVKQSLMLNPDVVVMDMTMPELNGLDAAIQLKQRRPETEILIFTGYVTDDLIRDAFEAGVKSFINKSDANSYLVEAIESLSRHRPFFTDHVSNVLFSQRLDRPEGSYSPSGPGQRLSQREREIVQLICEGKGNKEVAKALGVSVRTAETHRANILRKLNLESTAGLVRYAIRNRLIQA